MFKLEFSTDTEAFSDPDATEAEWAESLECRRILLTIADRLHVGVTSGNVLDFNGNTVGSWALS